MFHHIFIQLYKPILEAYFNKISMFPQKKKKKENIDGLAFCHSSQGASSLAAPHVAKNILYIKLTYCDHLNKNIEHFNLRITKIWVQ